MYLTCNDADHSCTSRIGGSAEPRFRTGSDPGFVTMPVRAGSANLGLQARRQALEAVGKVHSTCARLRLHISSLSRAPDVILASHQGVWAAIGPNCCRSLHRMHMHSLQKVCSVVKKAPTDLPLSCGEVPGAKNLGQHNFDHVITSELADSCQLPSAANCGSDRTAVPSWVRTAVRP